MLINLKYFVDQKKKKNTLELSSKIVSDRVDAR